jgi:hypothetical protein
MKIHFKLIGSVFSSLRGRLIPANFPDSGGIFPISTILPDFPVGIFKILNFPDFL